MGKLIISDEPVFFLQIRKYSETSMLLDCFSPNYGRFSILGKGILKPVKRNPKERPRLFHAYKLSAIIRTGLGTLTAIESNHIWNQPQGQKWYIANYLNELLIKLLPMHDSTPYLYEQYVRTVDCLTRDENYAFSLLLFEKRLLESQGYGINLQQEAISGASIKSSLYYRFDPVSGLAGCDQSYRHAVSGSIVTALEHESIDFFQKNVHALAQAKRIIRMSLKHHLGNMKLKTVEVLKDVAQFTEYSL